MLYFVIPAQAGIQSSDVFKPLETLPPFCYNYSYIRNEEKAMSLAHSINVSDLADQDTVHRVLSEIQSHGTSYSLVQDGVEVAKFVPAERKSNGSDKVSEEVTKKRWEAFARAEALSEEITRLWSTNETALEAIQNDRR